MCAKQVKKVAGEVPTTGHEWDGIREYDNPMPRWWVWVFYATIVWGIGYVIAYPAWPLIDHATRGVLGQNTRADVEAEIKRFDSPETEPYDRCQPKLHRSASALVQEHVDAVLFANYRISTLKSDVGFKKQVTRGVSGGDRLLHTVERPAFLAKNRYDLPDTLALEGPSIRTQARGFTRHQPGGDRVEVIGEAHPLPPTAGGGHAHDRVELPGL